MGENRCVVCGVVIPEGRWVCSICEEGKQNKNEEDKDDGSNDEIKYNI